MEKITQFQGEHRWLSNFYQSPIELRGVIFPSAEAAYQASKAKDYNLDPIFCKLTPGQSKKLGKNIIPREDWDEIKLEVMETILRIKFKDPDLRKRLLATGDAELYEGNSWGDKFWGCDWQTLEGENNLGKLLMTLREEFKKQLYGKLGKYHESNSEAGLLLTKNGGDVSNLHEQEVPE